MDARWRERPEPGAGADAAAGVTGVVVVTHGCVCGDLVSAAEGIVGSLVDVVSVPTDALEPAPDIQRRVGEAVAAADRGHGILILADLHGSTPANACIAQLARGDVEVVFGVNLPMLIKLSTCDRHALRPQQLGELLRDTGRRSIRLATEMVSPQAPPK